MSLKQSKLLTAEHDIKLTSTHLPEFDSELNNILLQEHNRQRQSIALIPSENYTSRAVLQGLGSILHNNNRLNSEYNPNNILNICRQRALDAYSVDNNSWGVNVEPLSGSPANFYAYAALLNPGDRIMSLDLPHM